MSKRDIKLYNRELLQTQVEKDAENDEFDEEVLLPRAVAEDLEKDDDGECDEKLIIPQPKLK